MSGHSHWAGIKHKKAKEDKRRGKAFSRASKQIMTSVRHGGKDPELNLDLKYAIEAAKAVNMPRDTIERAILKAAGELDGVRVEPVRYEGYGPGGIAVMADALTDNRNRTTSHIRRVFDVHSGELGATGCVAWSFNMKGLIIAELAGTDEEGAFDAAIEAGAEDFQKAGDVYEISCDPKDLQQVRAAVEKGGLRIESAEATMVPKTYVDLDADNGRKALKLMEELEEDEDITNVYSNFNLPPELVAQMQGQ